MQTLQTAAAEPANASPPQPLKRRVFGVGNAGLQVVERVIAEGLPSPVCVALNNDPQSLAASAAAEKILVETSFPRGAGPVETPERGPALAEAQLATVKSLCEGLEVACIVAGLGGTVGTGLAPALARVARESGALVLAFVMLPFDWEGSRRQGMAHQGLKALREAADGVICLPNQKAAKLIDENTSVLECFKLTNSLLADGVRGIWRLLTHAGLLEIHFADLCALLRGRHTESAFAAAEAMGATRSREVVQKLLAHPLLDGGQVLAESNAVLVSLVAGPDLTMAEINRVMEGLNRKCESAQVIMGAAIDAAFSERLAVTIIAARKSQEQPEREHAARGSAGELDTQLLPATTASRPESRFVPPPPSLPLEQMEKLLARQSGPGSRPRKLSPRMRQTQLPLEIISKGRFDKSEPTIHKGEDLDVPTYIRRGVALN
jgi:cell division protein FtsZ